MAIKTQTVSAKPQEDAETAVNRAVREVLGHDHIPKMRLSSSCWMGYDAGRTVTAAITSGGIVVTVTDD